MDLRDDIKRELLDALARDFRFKPRRGAWLQGGTCPQCGKKEVFANADNPRIIKCGRIERCGWDATAKDLYPEIFDSFSKRFQATDDNPHAAAEAYLAHARGLDLKGLRDAFAQEWYQDRERKIGSATVRFALPGGGWWERLIDQPGRFDRKARFAPGKSYAGQWWQRPDVSMADLATAETVWINEGIFDALSIEQAGQRAVSIMSCYNYPAEALKALRMAVAAGDGRAPKLIWALDLGRAGTEKTREFVERARNEGWLCGAAQVLEEGDDGRKLDWNDLLQRDRLGVDRRADYLWNGDILIAATAAEKAMLIRERHRLSSFHFVFKTRTYWASYNAATAEELATEQIQAKKRKLEDVSDEEIAEIRREAARSSMGIEEIANCAFRALYRQRDPAVDETRYFLNIDFPSDRPSVKEGFSAAAMMTSGDFKKRLFEIGTGAMWTGSQGQLDRIMQRQTPGIAEVQPLSFTGYCRDTGAYVFGDIAVKDGRVYRPNDDDYFSMGKLALKLGTSERLLDIAYDADELDTSWLDDLWTAYGPKGLVILAFFFGSLFAEQARREQKSFPFLEMFGLPGSGKTTLVEFLWKLCGRENYEGFDPAKATQAAMARNLGKVGNLPVVLIEGDRQEGASHARKFEWEELKTAYNGRTVRSRGVKNSGMETFEPPFRGAIVIEQNEPVAASRAILERIMSLGFDMEGWSEDTKAAAQRLEQWPVERVSGFIVHAARREEQVMQRYRQAFAMHEEALLALPGLRTNRLAKTHGQLLAMLDCLKLVVPNRRDAQRDAAAGLIQRMALQRQLAVNAEHPDVALFWERFDYLEETESDNPTNPVNHSRDPKLIAVSLSEFEQR
ncbi:MAG: toprim domain-containing protein, partial [Rhizorhabdus sp.]